MTADPARKEKGPAGCWGSSPRPGALARAGAAGGPSRARPRAGGGARVGGAGDTLPSLLSPPGAEGP